jgi:subtilase family serine protease
MRDSGRKISTLALAGLMTWIVAGVAATPVLASTAKVRVGSVSAAKVRVGSVSAAEVRVGSVSPLPRQARITGTVPAQQTFHLTVALEPQDPNGLTALATAVSTPGTPAFRRYLTVSQFAHRFGASPLQVAAVQSALRAQGLNVGPATANDLTIPVTGTAAQVQNAFAVSLSRVQLPSGRTAYANQQAPALPSSIAPDVQAVLGLDDLTLDQPQDAVAPAAPAASQRAPAARAHVMTGGPQPCAAASTVVTGTHFAKPYEGAHTADQIAYAYHFPGLYATGDEGAGQTVALLEENPYDPADIAAYQACYGTSTSVSSVIVGAGYPTGATTATSDEPPLDIEQVIGLAPKANILVYGGSSVVPILTAVVSQDLAKVISTSYGTCSAGAAAPFDTELKEAAVQGQSYFNSTGDSGSAGCYSSTSPSTTSSPAVNVYAGDPFATAVGGTSLYSSGAGGVTTYTPGQPAVEGVWNDGVGSSGSPSATGGGISTQWAMPSYQSGAPAGLGVINADSNAASCGSTYCREEPDVSADADPASGYVIFAQGVWTIVGGTSASAPLWASFAALVDASTGCPGTIGFVNPALYQIAGGAYATNFNDTSQPSPNTGVADNDALGVNGGLFPVTTGYDMSTGLGSMNAPQLAASLCGLPAPVYSIAVTNPGPQNTVVGHPVALQLTSSDSAGLPVSYSATGLPAGLNYSPYTGLIYGTPTTPGASSVAVTASDGVANPAGAQFSWEIAPVPVPAVKPGLPSSSHASLAGLAKRAAKLTFTVAAGAHAPALKALTISLPGGLSFARKSRFLAKGIVVRGADGTRVKFNATLKRGSLTITLTQVSAKVTVTITRPAVIVSAGLAGRARRHKLKQLTLRLSAVDASHRATGLKISL